MKLFSLALVLVGARHHHKDVSDNPYLAKAYESEQTVHRLEEEASQLRLQAHLASKQHKKHHSHRKVVNQTKAITA